MMKAIVSEQYGNPGIMKLKEVEKPLPKPNEVLIKIHNTSLNAADWRFLRGAPYFMRLMFGVFKPKIKILGADIAGEIVDIGMEISQFKIGDRVFGDIMSDGFGGLAEYATAKEKHLCRIPDGYSFEQVVAIPLAGITALQGLRDVGNIKSGQKVLIYGASGGVGTYAVQLAKYFGADVTAVCSTGKVEMVKSLGADHVIDYKKEDFTKPGRKYDLIFAVNGDNSLKTYKKVMNDRARYVMAGGSNKQIFEAVFFGKLKSRKNGMSFAHVSAHFQKDDLEFLKGLLENGFLKVVVDKKYPLEQSREAMEYLYEGHAKGKIIISVC